MDQTNDLRIFYAAWPAVDVSWHSKTGVVKIDERAIFDQPGITILGGEVLATEYGLRYPATTFPSVREGDTFVIGAGTYTARENAQPTLDGLEQTVPLAKVS